MKTRILLSLTLAVAGMISLPQDAHAYIGPGVGMTAIGTLVALIGAIVFAIIGFVWYPIKRLLTMFKNRGGGQGGLRPEVHTES